jgi:hypothetical protein
MQERLKAISNFHAEEYLARTTAQPVKTDQDHQTDAKQVSE